MATGSPLLSVALGIIHELIARYPEHATLLQLLGQRNDIKVEEVQLVLIPFIRRVLVGTATLESFMAFSEESFVPLDVNLPMSVTEGRDTRSKLGTVLHATTFSCRVSSYLLHCVTDITGLNHVLNHDGRLPVAVILGTLLFGTSL